MNCGSCTVGGQKSKHGYRYAELGAVKAKKKLGMFKAAHCSLNLLCSQEREREKLIPLFCLSLQQNHLPHILTLGLLWEKPRVKHGQKRRGDVGMTEVCKP